MDMTTLIAAAATAAGPAPHSGSAKSESYPAWRGRVLAISADLAAMVGGYESREARKRGEGFDEADKITVFFATLVKVKEITKGQGDKTVRKGELTLQAHNSSNADSNGHETIETAPLGSPEGDEEFLRAQSLVGQNVKIYKRNFLHPTDKSKKLKELVAVDAASGFAAPPASSLVPLIMRGPAEATPAGVRILANPACSDQEQLAAVREQLNALPDEDKATFKAFMENEGRPLKGDEWTDEDLGVIEEWLFGGNS